MCDVFVCSVWKAAGLFKEIDDDFSLLAALLLMDSRSVLGIARSMSSQTRDSVDLDTLPRYLQI